MSSVEEGYEAFQAGEYTRARDILKRYADAECRQACVMLASLWLAGKGGSEDLREAARLFEIAARGNDPKASYNLASLYERGHGVCQDDREALSFYKRAADLGNTKGMVKVGTFYAAGKGVERDIEKARTIWETAAEAGNRSAMRSLGDFHNGIGPRQCVPTAVKWYVKAALQGDRCAASFAVDLREVLESEAQDGSAEASYQLGELVMASEKDHALASHWFEIAADQGHAAAQFSLGQLHEKGNGVPPNTEFAIVMHHKAAENGDALAQLDLARHYATGKMVGQDAEKAIEYYREAAGQGLSEAYLPLGNALSATGKKGEATQWYLKSAEAGDIAGMYLIAACYTDGIGVDRDLVQAARWYFAMWGQGDGDGIHRLPEVVDKMTGEEVREAARLAGDETWARLANSGWLAV